MNITRWPESFTKAGHSQESAVHLEIVYDNDGNRYLASVFPHGLGGYDCWANPCDEDGNMDEVEVTPEYLWFGGHGASSISEALATMRLGMDNWKSPFGPGQVVRYKDSDLMGIVRFVELSDPHLRSLGLTTWVRFESSGGYYRADQLEAVELTNADRLFQMLDSAAKVV